MLRFQRPDRGSRLLACPELCEGLALSFAKGLAIEYERSGRGEWMMDDLRWIPMHIGKRTREEFGLGGGLAPP
jgi:hypothetical protein